ncbi:MAG TPA: universal stress protein [Candidatus Acidoferrum sp.]|jgi:nucleotide-binding universal stress UspA family protein
MLAAQRKFENGPQRQKRVVFRNILLASDYSASANLAMPYAAGMARSFGAKLYAMHVQEPINYALPPATWQGLELTREMEEKFLVEAIRRDFPEVHPHVLHAEGVVWRAIEAAIQKHEIDLVVVGTRGRTGIEKALLGSVAEEILRHAPCPVLTVGPQACHEAGRRGRMASILFATDFGKASLTAAPIAVSLAEEYQAKLTLLHVKEKRAAGQTPGDAAGPCGAAEKCEQRLRALVAEEAKLWCEPHFVVDCGGADRGSMQRAGAAWERILGQAQAREADLIVMGVHDAESFPLAGAASHLETATVHGVVAHAQVPVLTVRGGENL